MDNDNDTKLTNTTPRSALDYKLCRTKRGWWRGLGKGRAGEQGLECKMKKKLKKGKRAKIK